MGSVFAAQERNAKVLLLGLDGSGKSTILHRIVYDEDLVIELPGVNQQVLPYKNVNFSFNDIKGDNECRSFWNSYLLDTNVLIYVVDSSNKSRLQEASIELKNLLTQPDLNSVPVLVWLNKQDLPEALACEEIEKEMQLSNLLKGHVWKTQRCSGVTADGLFEGLDFCVSTF